MVEGMLVHTLGCITLLVFTKQKQSLASQVTSGHSVLLGVLSFFMPQFIGRFKCHGNEKVGDVASSFFRIIKHVLRDRSSYRSFPKLPNKFLATLSLR